MITLWGRANSSNVQKITWALEELGPGYERIDLGGPFGGLDAPSYRALNPNGKVPTLRDGDLVIWESHAILRYLAARYGAGRLWPDAPDDRAIADQWTDWTATTFQPAWSRLFRLFVRTPADQHDKVAIGRALGTTYGCFGLLDARLGAVPYLAGEAFTYADIAAGVAMFRWTSMKIERPPMPNVMAWHARLDARRAFRKAVCVSYDDLVGRLSF